MRPDIQIISSANLDRNVSTLHRTGADFVMSYPILGVDAIFSFLMKHDVLMLVDGLTLFRIHAPSSLAGVTLAQSGIRQDTGCSVVAITTKEKHIINPGPFEPVSRGSEIILIGTYDAERQFFKIYSKS